MRTSEIVKIINGEDQSESFGDKEAFILDILVGLSATRKNISSKYMYDDEGSRLFKKITELGVYYPTLCEVDALSRHAERIGSYVADSPFNLVEFGPGNGRKASILIDRFLEMNLDFRYVPIDISALAIDELAENMTERFPALETCALVSDYFAGTRWLNRRYKRKNLVLFLGSNIGNFPHDRARFFLRNVWNCLNSGDNVLIGFDLKKDIEMLLWAYNDPDGVTARFNLNVLKRINRELGGQFDVSRFRHYGTYDVRSGAMESYLVSLEHQEVFIEEIGRSFTFSPWEPIHMEYSYKYLISDIDNIASETGYSIKEHLYDSKDYFVDSMWEVRKSDS